jgi:hypothetical protein
MPDPLNIAQLPEEYETPRVEILSASTLENAELRLVTGESVTSEEGEYYY